MTIKLLDYKHNPQEFNIGELEKIRRITIRVISGDELAEVEFKNEDQVEIYDSDTNGRSINYFDGEYVVYDADGHWENLLENNNWLNRKTSYEGLFM